MECYKISLKRNGIIQKLVNKSKKISIDERNEDKTN